MTLSRLWKAGGYTGAIYPDMSKKHPTKCKSSVPAVRRKRDPDVCECATLDVEKKKNDFV